MYNRNLIRKAKAVIGLTFSSTTASTVSTISSTTYGRNFEITFQAMAGNTWVDPTTTATTNSFKLTPGDEVDFMVDDELSIVSDSTTASYQAIIWDGQ